MANYGAYTTPVQVANPALAVSPVLATQPVLGVTPDLGQQALAAQYGQLAVQQPLTAQYAQLAGQPGLGANPALGQLAYSSPYAQLAGQPGLGALGQQSLSSPYAQLAGQPGLGANPALAQPAYSSPYGNLTGQQVNAATPYPSPYSNLDPGLAQQQLPQQNGLYGAANPLAANPQLAQLSALSGLGAVNPGLIYAASPYAQSNKGALTAYSSVGGYGSAGQDAISRHMVCPMTEATLAAQAATDLDGEHPAEKAAKEVAEAAK